MHAGKVLLIILCATSAHAQSFLYQLQNLNVTNAAASSFAWVVTDYSHDGSAAGELSSNEVATLRSGKTVLAYLSIGEAENYRFYWDASWLKSNRPSWLGPVNPSWRGNYEVKYWDPAWQAIVLGYLDRILAQGFDGAYLDIVDGYEFWGPDGNNQNPNAPQDMVTFVKQLAAYARAKHPGFLIFPQNASALVTNADYLATISGIGQEDTWFNGDKRQKPADTAEVTGFLDLVRAAGKPVLSIDYVRKQHNIDLFYSIAEAKGYTPYASVRNLDQLVVNLHHNPGTTNVPAVLAPADGAEVRTDSTPTFRWPKSGLLFWLNFAGDDAFTKVVTIPSTGTASTNYTPTATEWAAVSKLGGNRLWWWLTAQDGNQQLRSSLARRLYPLHTNISTTYFWVGEPSDADNHFIPNDASAWDDLWKQHFGGVDDPNARDPLHPYWPAAFMPKENPFYFALPFNDFDKHGNQRENLAQIVPWARGVTYGPLESALKNHWVKITFAGKTCYAQWEDVGPFGENDSKYVFGTSRPKNKANQNAGLDVSPAVKDYLGLTGLNPTDWRFFFSEETVPAGPWSEIITTNQITWLP
jgi:uncharacterized protein (TIGR01370 family)